ncbi:tRNA 2'-phosphotransferase [Aphanomyces cochlioides]|nr:tRNA 2'-phosphotransferase [Aphanomyces cochlioides]
MLVWMDIFTDDEVVSDSHKVVDAKDKEGNPIPGMLEVGSKTVTKGGVNVDVGCGDAFGGAEEEVDDSVETVNNIIDESVGFGYTETGFNSKADLKTYLKSYFRKIMKHLKSTNASDEKLEAFKSDAQEIVKALVALYDDLQYYMFRSMDTEAGMAFSYYKDGDTTPTFLYIKWGLKEVKF